MNDKDLKDYYNEVRKEVLEEINNILIKEQNRQKQAIANIWVNDKNTLLSDAYDKIVVSNDLFKSLLEKDKQEEK